MQAEVVPFPRSGNTNPTRNHHAAPPIRQAGDRRTVHVRREYSFAEVVGLLSLPGQARTQIDYLRDLADQCGMPLPKNPRRHAGRLQTGPAMIGSRSRWCALEFDAWIDGLGSPPPAASLNPETSDGAARSAPPTASLRMDMKARALRIAAGGC